MLNLLSIITFLPAAAAVIMAFWLHGDDANAQRQAKILALAATSVTFLISLILLFSFDPANPGFQQVVEREWIMGLTYKMGVDGISVLFVMLTTFLMPITIAACWNVNIRVKEYMIAFLLLETLLIGVFVALDLVLFYLFFEAGLKEPDLCGVQVLPLHLLRVGADAGGDDLHVHAGRHDGHPDASDL